MSRTKTAIAGVCAALAVCTGALAVPAGASAGTAELVRFCWVDETTSQKTGTIVSTPYGAMLLVVEDSVTCLEREPRSELRPTLDQDKIAAAVEHFHAPPPGEDRYAVVQCGDRGSTAVGQKTPSRASMHGSVQSLGRDHGAMLAACEGEVGDSGSGDSIEDMIDAGVKAPSSAAMDCSDGGSANPYAQNAGGAPRTAWEAQGVALSAGFLAKHAVVDAERAAMWGDLGVLTASAAVKEATVAAEKALDYMEAATKAAVAASDAKTPEKAGEATKNAQEAAEKAQRAQQEAQEAAKKAEAATNKVKRAAAGMAALSGAVAGGATASGTPPKKGTKHPTGPSASSDSLCADLQHFMWECEQAGWKTGTCQIFLNMLNKCGDVTIARISEDGALTCGQDQIPPEQMDAALRASCEINTRPVPGHDPCDPTPPAEDAPSGNPPGCDPTITQTIDGSSCPTPEPAEAPDPGPDCLPAMPGVPPPPCPDGGGPPGPGPKKTATLDDLDVREMATAPLAAPQLALPPMNDVPGTAGMPEPPDRPPVGGQPGHLP